MDANKYAPTPGAPLKLSDAENRRIYEEEIRPTFLGEGKPQDSPTAILLGGQPGSGKSTVRRGLLNRLEEPVVVDADDLRLHHPDYTRLAETGKEASEKTHPDAAIWGQYLQQDARAERRNVLVDMTMGNPVLAEKIANDFAEAGYRVEAHVLSVPAAVSRAAIVQRYEDSVALTGEGRWVDPAYHDKVFSALPESVARLEQSRVAKAIEISHRDGTQVYRNRVVGETWEQKPTGAEALNEYRTRPLTMAEMVYLRASWVETLRKMEARRADIGEVNAMKGLAEQGEHEQRALSFRKDVRTEAVEKHPELRAAYEVVRAAELVGQQQFPNDPTRQATFVEMTRNQLAEKLHRGQVPSSTIKGPEQSRSEDRDLDGPTR